jgi:hypothetical protein
MFPFLPVHSIIAFLTPRHPSVDHDFGVDSTSPGFGQSKMKRAQSTMAGLQEMAADWSEIPRYPAW